MFVVNVYITEKREKLAHFRLTPVLQLVKCYLAGATLLVWLKSLGTILHWWT